MASERANDRALLTCGLSDTGRLSPRSLAEAQRGSHGAVVGNSERHLERLVACRAMTSAADSNLLADGLYAEGVRNAVLLRDEGIFSEAEFVREREVFVDI